MDRLVDMDSEINTTPTPVMRRPINRNIRIILSTVSKLYSKVLEENTVMMDVRRNVHLSTATMETRQDRKKNPAKYREEVENDDRKAIRRLHVSYYSRNELWRQIS
ncbi:PREDICTED: uncharacterized protein LOC108975480 [Bactrocera latifrons]|uniref:uncharacterized protein LOC108975480 n=1 Tax=Bactrocera latifrons TaxID=174628 RepID=UPI0008DE8C06|nr:PREDICTED: uncharacterized protein LOC108975480 [Bactrocera latifrons]